ncbi:MAG: transcriptional repressor [Planctomycetes bacterium]|nr:transcriptional repressor [Planctomycetota bacterium]NOG53827.1 transcriptional repressor [Planctomycetota bacterium]
MADHSAQSNPGTVSSARSGDDYIVPLCSVFRQHLHGENLKFTPERAQVLDAIIQMERVFEADELLFEMRRRKMRVSKATIYRTIRLLVDAGIIEQILYDQKQAHYRMAYGQAPHDQMVCVETGRVLDFSIPELVELRDRIAAEHGWSPVGHRFQIFAISPDSESAEPDAEDEQ